MYGKILVVDDDPDIIGLVKQTLETEGYEVHTAGEGDEALDILTKVRPDVVILDIMLPKKDGLTLCQEMRHITTSPILMLSARATDLDRILGLEIGADDYLTKPFNPKELVARVRAMLRRQRVYQPSGNQSAEGEEVLAHQNLKIFPARRRVEVDGKEVKLTPIEFSLLRTLVSHAGMTLTRQQLLDNVWGPDFFGDERTVDAHIRNLRMRLQAVAPHAQFITSVWRVGYKFDV
jgi:DNA-binding response OmpR family regulator